MTLGRKRQEPASPQDAGSCSLGSVSKAKSAVGADETFARRQSGFGGVMPNSWKLVTPNAEPFGSFCFA
jgi:hypothetical protein